MRSAQTVENKPTDHARGITKLGIPQPPHYPIGVKRVHQSECGRHGLSNILKLQATFLYSINHQRAGKTNLFYIRGGRFHAGNMLCTFNTMLTSEAIFTAKLQMSFQTVF